MTPSCENPFVPEANAVGPQACHLFCPACERSFPAVAPEVFYRLATGYLAIEWPKIPEQDHVKCIGLKARLEELSAGYNSLSSSPLPDFNDPLTRLAYIFCYLPSRAHISSRICSAHPCIGDVLLTPGVTVTCLGNGPGSELLGLMATCKPPHDVTFHLVDLYATTWADWLLRTDNAATSLRNAPDPETLYAPKARSRLA